MSDAVQEVVDAIHAAFAGVERGVITLHEAEVIDDYGAADERAAARRVDGEERWEAIPDAHIEACPNALPHLDPQSWSYYLPRFMTWTLRNFDRSRSLVVDHTIYTLLLGDDRALNDYARQRYERLTPAQSQAVQRFLSLMGGQEAYCDARAASQAIERYWHRAETGGVC